MQEKFIFHNQNDTQNFAKKLAEDLISKTPISRRNLDIGADGAVFVALYGDLGVGKTTFAQGFARGLGVKEKTKSPTFVIMRKSEIRSTKLETNQKSKILNLKQRQKQNFKHFYHFDVYRIHDEKEILNLGWEEIIKNPENIILVEWADKIEKILPEDRVKIYFKHLNGDKREIVIKSQ